MQTYVTIRRSDKIRQAYYERKMVDVRDWPETQEIASFYVNCQAFNDIH